MKPPRTIFGIDLGTTFSAIAWIDPHGRAEVIPNREGERLTPSVVLFEGNHSIVVGRVAAQEAIAQPDRVVQSVKRHMGDADWIWECDGNFYRPQDISALILRKLKQDAEQYTQMEVREVVLTVPAYFNEQQRLATREAAELAGLVTVRLINEPTAAALFYGTHAFTEEEGWSMVFDIGGGTFDVTLLEMTGGQLHVRASNGHIQLGGQDWDDLILHHLSVQFFTQYGVDPLDDPRAWQGLKERVVHAKHALSHREQAHVPVSHAGFFSTYVIQREEFETLAQPLLGQCEDLCHLVLEEAGITAEQLRSVYLVGGSSRLPMLRRLVELVTKQEPKTLHNPDESVACGAAVQGARCVLERYGEEALSPQQENYHKQIRRLTGRVAAYDVSSHSLGVLVLDLQSRSFVDRLVSRYTPLPHTHQETYYTAHDDQISIEVRIVEGESDDPEECVEVGVCELTGLPPRPAGQRVEVEFTYDLDGILTVSVVDLGSGRRRRMEIQRGIHRPHGEREAMQRLIQGYPVPSGLVEKKTTSS